MSLTSIAQICEDRRAMGMTCAYSGRPLTIRVTRSGSGKWFWFAMHLSAPTSTGKIPLGRQRFKSPKEVLEALGQRNGVMGILQGKAALKCPYTGSQLTLRQDHLGWFAIGGWDPFRPCADLCTLEYFTRMRNGVPAEDTIPEQKREKIVVTDVEEKELPMKIEASQSAQQLAHDLTDRFVSKVKGRKTVTKTASVLGLLACLLLAPVTRAATPYAASEVTVTTNAAALVLAGAYSQSTPQTRGTNGVWTYNISTNGVTTIGSLVKPTGGAVIQLTSMGWRTTLKERKFMIVQYISGTGTAIVYDGDGELAELSSTTLGGIAIDNDCPQGSIWVRTTGTNSVVVFATQR